MKTGKKKLSPLRSNGSSKDARKSRRGGARQLVFVLGMHRSGTSMVTRLINLLGASLPKNLLPAREDNETGYWESLGGMVLNDQILGSLGLSWRDATNVPEDWFRSQAAETFRDRIADLLSQEFQDASLAVLKDPRISRLFPIWRSAAESAGWTCSTVLMLRDPREVAASLRFRNGISFPAAAILWLRYVLEAERASRDLPRIVMSYDEALSDWRSSLKKIAEALTLGDGVLGAATAEEADSFVSPERKHHAAMVEEGYVPEIALQIYQDMVDSTRDPQSYQALLDSVLASLTTIGPVLPSILQMIEEHAPDRDKIWSRTLDSMLEWRAGALDRDLAASRAASRELELALKDCRDWHALETHRLEAQIAVTEERLESARQHERHLLAALDQATRSIIAERELRDHATSIGETLTKTMAQAEAKLGLQAQLIEQTKFKMGQMSSRLDHMKFLEHELRSGSEENITENRQLLIENSTMKLNLGEIQSTLRSRDALIVQWALKYNIFDEMLGFDEAAYLEANPDVKTAVSEGGLRSGFEHWVRWGFQEKRPPCFLSDLEGLRPA